MPKTYSLKRYRDEAHKPPFPLELENGETLELPGPTVDEVIVLNGLTDVRAQLEILAKDNFEKLMAEIGPLPGAALQPLMDDVLRHFGLQR